GLQARYGHISEAKVKEGQMVKKGAIVAISGESGITFGPHLHFELYCGGAHQRVNPRPYLE
ncbi:MAG: M23 family metallopeptidase, partial [Ignavibacteria bacterium]|nr:M23 family metallopeptidase [Ignavibacteria bacterium]